MKKFEVVHADTCLPSYWSGHHLPHVQIPVVPGMSLKAIKQELKSELSMGAVMGNDDNVYLLSGDWVGPENKAKATQATKAAHAAINRMKPATKGQRKFFTDIEECDDCEECVYAYFVFVEQE